MFIYEMHQHTAGVSACAADNPEPVVRELKRAGFAGMVLTNHFYHGNTGVRRQLPWEDFVHPFVQAYERAKKAAKPLDFDVLFGLEEGVGGGKEVLLYGITPDFVYTHPELREVHLAELATLVRDAGGVVVQAHPFRVRDYITAPWEELPVECLDGIEVYNAGNDDLSNERARTFCEANGLIAVAGSDAHSANVIGRAGIMCRERVRTEQALAQVLRDGDYELYIE